MNTYRVLSLLPLLLLIGGSFSSAAQQTEATTAEMNTTGDVGVATLNQHHQQTQLKIQQQRLDNELLRLRLDYADMRAELRQLDSPPVEGATTAANKPVASSHVQIVSQVDFSNIRLQWLGGEQPRWRLTQLSRESRHD
jgi:hypothetical protein